MTIANRRWLCLFRITILPVLLLLSTLVAYAEKETTDDSALTRRLIGTWDPDPTDKSRFVGTAIYHADGTGVEYVHLRDQPVSTSVIITTRWSIKDGILCLKCVSSSDPQRPPVGTQLQDRIISFSDDRCVFEDYKGYGDGKEKQEVKIRRKK